VLLKLLGKDRNPLGLLEDIDRLGLRLDAALAKVSIMDGHASHIDQRNRFLENFC
jgi:hypothetical protein